MRFKLIACGILKRELDQLVKRAGQQIDVTCLPQGMHNDPGELRGALQREIDRADSDPLGYDAILIGYGLCSNGPVGIRSGRYPLVIPRAHDCITLFLGSGHRYRELFDQESGGIYWFTAAWIDQCPMPSRRSEEQRRNEIRQIYGSENIDFLLEAERSWVKDYKCFAFIEFPGFREDPYREFTRKSADYFGLEFKNFRGDDSLLKDFLSGNWDHVRFQIVEPNQTLGPSYDDSIFTIEKRC
ncbi:MAG TPA: DUF1638 domain-containing protein [Clostridia bacterium]|nr:DUF1638 domain-containing protein [Clostridia bacterium]